MRSNASGRFLPTSSCGMNNDSSSELNVPFFVTRSVKIISGTRKKSKKKMVVSYDLQIHKLRTNADLLTYIALRSSTKQEYDKYRVIPC